MSYTGKTQIWQLVLKNGKSKKVRAKSAYEAAKLLGITLGSVRRVVALGLVAWLVSSSVSGNSRECRYSDAFGRSHVRVLAASHLCPERLEL